MPYSRNIRRSITGIALAVTLMAVAIPAVHAQQQTIEVTAEVDKNELAVGEDLTLRVRIDGSLNPQQPAIPEFDGLRPMGPPSIQRQTWIRGGTSGYTFSYLYQFVATKVGTVTIDPISVTISGQTYRTEPIKVEVFQGLGVSTPVPGQGQASSQGPPSAEGSMFVTAEVDDETPYLGQQITYTFKFYRRSALFPSFGRYGQPRLSEPGFSGFWKIQEPDQDEYTETIGSNRYQVVKLTTVLFPTVVGTLVIEPTGLTVPIDFFEAPNYLEAEPIVVEVLPLPPGAPAGFTGAVGKFNVSADVDDTDGKVNEPVQLAVRVVGEGNIDSLPDPAWPDFDDWRVFESPSDTSSRLIDGRFVGTRTYNSVLVPQKAGLLTVPEIGYTYYDPSIDEYVEAASQPIVMSIAEGDGMSPLPPLPGDGTAVERAGSDVRHIKPVPSSLHESGSGLTGSAVYWAVWGVPLLAIAGAVAWRRRQSASRSGIAAARKRNALPAARSALAVAGESGADPRVAVADILLEYLAARLDVSVTGLTHEALDKWLQSLGVPLDLAVQVEGVLGAAEMAKYAPEIGDSLAATEHFERTAKLLSDLDEAIDA
ncbi:MAG: protein BatD [Dehalococcoidia bacterium]|nr:protein BatD [Dehalococcoidia bacterium]